MSDSKTIRFGATEVNLASVVAMSEEEFKTTFSGILNVDINDAWKEVKKHQPKATPKKKKSYKKED
jgi:hypothetical protein